MKGGGRESVAGRGGGRRWGARTALTNRLGGRSALNTHSVRVFPHIWQKERKVRHSGCIIKVIEFSGARDPRGFCWPDRCRAYIILDLRFKCYSFIPPGRSYKPWSLGSRRIAVHFTSQQKECALLLLLSARTDEPNILSSRPLSLSLSLSLLHELFRFNSPGQ